MEQQNEQHLKIINKIIQKYGNPKTQTLKDWLRKYSDLSTQQINSVIAKYQSFVGYSEDQEWKIDQIKLFILVAVAAQKGKDLMDLRESNIYKYKKHSFVIAKKPSNKTKQAERKEKQENGKQEKVDRREEAPEIPLQKLESIELNESIKIERKVEVQPKIQQAQNKSQQNGKKVSQPREELPEENLNNKNDHSKETQKDNNALLSPPSPSLFPILESQKTQGENSFKKNRSNLDTSKSPVAHPQIKPPPLNNFDKSPARQKPTKDLDQSISTKMEALNPNKNQKSEATTPTFPIKPFDQARSFFESHIQIENYSSKNKLTKHLQIKINKFQKFSEGWSSVVKYEIVTPDENHANILRRYSEFAKLHSYLTENYKGTIIPELPPKEYLKGAIWAADHTFLNERRLGLELFLNKVLAHETLGQDHLVLRFIDDQKLDDESYGAESYMQAADKYLKTLLSITKNTSQIRDYGVAYYSYMKSSVVDEVPTQINQLYDNIKSHFQKFNKFKDYVEKLDTIYTTRLQIQTQFLQLSQIKHPDDNFKKQLYQVAQQFSEAKSAYDSYCKLKAQTKWYELLYETKKTKASQTKQDQELKVNLEESETKVKKVTPMLEKQMRQFLKIKEVQWKRLLENFMMWKASKNAVGNW